MSEGMFFIKTPKDKVFSNLRKKNRLHVPTIEFHSLEYLKWIACGQ